MDEFRKSDEGKKYLREVAAFYKRPLKVMYVQQCRM